MSQSNKWSFVEASARSPANKNNIKKSILFWCEHLFLQQSAMQRSCSLCFQQTDQTCSEERGFFPSLSLSLSLARGKCKLNSFCMFEELSHITRSSLRLSLFNCPSISGAVVVLRLLRWLSQSRAPSRDVEFDVAALEEPQTGAETEM